MCLLLKIWKRVKNFICGEAGGGRAYRVHLVHQVHQVRLVPIDRENIPRGNLVFQRPLVVYRHHIGPVWEQPRRSQYEIREEIARRNEFHEACMVELHKKPRLWLH